jgi:hypothetical protein
MVGKKIYATGLFGIVAAPQIPQVAFIAPAGAILMFLGLVLYWFDK